MVKRRYIICFVCSIMIIAVLVLLNVFFKVDRVVNTEESEGYVVTTKILDGSDSYEVRLYNFETESKVYKNDELYMKIGDIGDIAEHIELDINSKGSKLDLSKYETNIDGVYKVEMEKSKEYACYLMHHGYVYQRVVLKENSIDIYLKNKDSDNIERLIILSDRLIKMEYEGKSLPEINNYFENRSDENES